MVLNDKRLFWSTFIVVFTLLTVAFVKTGVEPFTSFAINEEQPDVLILHKSGFSPSEIMIEVGDKVIWRNDMNYVSVLWSPSVDASFRSPILKSEESFSFTYNNPGTYKYVDVNFGYKGSVIVKDKSKAAVVSQEKPACQTCPSGCAQSFDDCTRCTCPCYQDSDCTDSDPCTVDLCGTEPVDCYNTKKAGCAYNLECLQEGQRIEVDGNQAICQGNAWLSSGFPIPKIPEQPRSPVLLIVIGFLLSGAAALAIIAVKKKYTPQKKKAKG